MDPRKSWMLGIIGIIVIGFLILSGNLVENVDSNEIMVIQAPISGTLTWHTTAGIKGQWFGKVTKYPKRSIYDLEVPVRFNDGGHGTMIGSIQYEMPLSSEHLTNLHNRFGSAEAIQKQLVETVANKSIYMTGPLMSSKESYAERRNYLLHYVEDQIANGVYKTTQKEVRTKDQMTGADKTVTIVEVVMGKNGTPERQEEAVLTPFGIKPFNFTITRLPYDEVIEAQIKKQQELSMEVQTAIAAAKQAEQRAITVAKEGEANAAKAKWDQEVIKAQAITEAQQKLEVARLQAEAASQTKKEQILLGEGEAERKRLVMNADGALEPKLKALVEINKAYAEAIKGYSGNWVPNVVFGGNGNGKAGSGAADLIEMLKAKTAMDLGVNMDVSGVNKTKK